ncbi:caltractin-like isoform X2 [Hylaeus volcanicus]|uniref:caltractin-like isoform X2 n=1 Tax=Hylaeus volcanicus TaxID=313075 RepID=UPI0023B7D1C8|nr:caltractin-like isoform X2 [Hylaeus volcanicus]
MSSVSTKDREEEDILAAFKLFDVNETGYVNPKELMTCLLEIDMEPYKCVILKIVSFLDDFMRQDEWLSYNDFKKMVEQTLNDSKTSLETMSNTFQFFDLEDTGVITVDSLKKTCDALGENFSDTDIRNMILTADANKDGCVDFDDFSKMLNHLKF